MGWIHAQSKSASIPFSIYLADGKLKEFNNMGKYQSESYSVFRGNVIPWIEKLLETPIEDYRKNAVSLILAPYLINIKKVLGRGKQMKITKKRGIRRTTGIVFLQLVLVGISGDIVFLS
jgi:hypothetical protein